MKQIFQRPCVPGQSWGTSRKSLTLGIGFLILALAMASGADVKWDKVGDGVAFEYAGKIHHSCKITAVNGDNVTFKASDGTFVAQWSRLSADLRAKLAADYKKLTFINKGLTEVSGVIVRKTKDGVLVETYQGPVVLLRGHPSQAKLADKEDLSCLGKEAGTYDYTTSFGANATVKAFQYTAAP